MTDTKDLIELSRTVGDKHNAVVHVDPNNDSFPVSIEVTGDGWMPSHVKRFISESDDDVWFNSCIATVGGKLKVTLKLRS